MALRLPMSGTCAAVKHQPSEQMSSHGSLRLLFQLRCTAALPQALYAVPCTASYPFIPGCGGCVIPPGTLFRAVPSLLWPLLAVAY